MPDQAPPIPPTLPPPCETPPAENETPQETSLNLTVKLEPGARLHLTLETHSADGKVVQRRSLDTTAGEGETAVTIEIGVAEQPGRRLPDTATGVGETAAAIKAGAAEQPGRRSLAENLKLASAAGAQATVSAAKRTAARVPPLRRSFEGMLRSVGWGLWLALAVYLVTRLVALADYPMYFFTDEAMQTLLASDLLHNGLRNEVREFLPTFFNNVYQYNLSVSVYVQVLPTLLFGKVVEVTRGVSVLFSLIPAACCGLAARQFFGSRYPWLAVLALSITPAWFLHSRTAFEVSLAVSFYAAFIYFYLRYRSGRPRSLYLALLFAALSFYTYSPAQAVVAVTAVLLFFSDLRYHLRMGQRVFLNTAAIAVLLLIPYPRFLIEHPDANAAHLQQINSYLTSQMPLLDKVGQYLGNYLAGLNPLYWFFSENIDFSRHVMGSFGNLLVFSLPFFAWGLVIAVRNLRSPAYRALLIAVLAAPSGAALAELDVTRALFMVIPAAILMAIGLESALAWLLDRWQKRRRALIVGAFSLLAAFNAFLLVDALTAGRTWSTDYGLNGMQYGARQVFAAISDLHQSSPELKFVISPTWANGTDNLQRYFLPDNFPIEMYSIDSYLNKEQPIEPNTVFVFPADEYQKAIDNPRFSDVNVVETVPWPNGDAGFYFITMRYSDQIDQIIADEQAKELAIQQATLEVGGETLTVYYSQVDMGSIGNLFDGDLNTLIRSAAANPLKIRIDFPSPHRLNGFRPAHRLEPHHPGRLSDRERRIDAAHLPPAGGLRRPAAQPGGGLRRAAGSDQPVAQAEKYRRP